MGLSCGHACLRVGEVLPIACYALRDAALHVFRKRSELSQSPLERSGFLLPFLEPWRLRGFKFRRDFLFICTYESKSMFRGCWLSHSSAVLLSDRLADERIGVLSNTRRVCCPRWRPFGRGSNALATRAQCCGPLNCPSCSRARS